ncbi:hypothetical protein [Microcoleus sp. herbarium12]|uniref:hypothetical protein n=1 Tax=Microcoleus sp. herbarium12 TaxID=3055437 RepID=UPI002FCF68EE
MTILNMVPLSSGAIDRPLYYVPPKNQFQRATIPGDWRITWRELVVRSSVKTAAVEATAKTAKTGWQVTNFRVCNC